MKPEDLEIEIELWAINAEAFSVFNSMSTQWRSGMSGATGLDYTALPVVMDLEGVKADNRQQVFRDVRTMEQEALRTMADNQE
ncbi:Phage related hypothetical protein [Pseudomonas mohnii]|uniref:Uncharacterized protein n=1 Tax=Pseudomonas mohnii TaxID=395600 RepID=A0ABY0YCE3_9PSED|nr:DUF1799 domain-containing protein [Pseudomonas mohnii]SED33190.1 Phage related hypothetical protein [Pseudomonas mohnii]